MLNVSISMSGCNLSISNKPFSRYCFSSPFRIFLRYLGILPFYQFMQPSGAVSPFSGSLLDFFDSFSVRLLQEQGPQNATRGDPDSSPGALPNARAGDPTGPSPVARRPPRWLSTATPLIRPNGSAAPAPLLSTPAASPWRWCLVPQRSSSPRATDAPSPPNTPHASAHRPWCPRAAVCHRRDHQAVRHPAAWWGTPHRAADATAGAG